ncbi:MAG: 2TM domain-containing protein [Myxococcales bacterium]|nr:2TM domain-containing protein [Myxococcales bacterium]
MHELDGLSKAERSERAAIERQVRARAARKVGSRLGFYWHASVFLMANMAMLAINLGYSPDTLWFQWPLGGWGAALILHAFATFKAPAMSERMIEAEVNRKLAERGII